jgi:hypothetical protein
MLKEKISRRVSGFSYQEKRQLTWTLPDQLPLRSLREKEKKREGEGVFLPGTVT